LDPCFAKHFGIKGPKEKGQKRKKKEVRVKLWGVFLGHTRRPILLYFFPNWGQMEDPSGRSR